MELAVLFGVCLLISGVAIRLGVAVASRLGVVDRPGGHKQHDTGTPFVGGIGIMAVILTAFPFVDWWFRGATLMPLSAILFGALAIFVAGLADDIWHLGFKPRFVVQAVVALSMVVLGGVELRSLGELLPGITFELGWLAIPVTIFATMGLINAVNMIDGIDGLSGSVSLVSLALVALVAHRSNHLADVFFIVAMMGAVVGFLFYNLRYPGNSRARVFLGDNGSMLLGFVFAWLFIALSQGSEAAMTPTTALWLFALPLMDTVGVMIRRVWLGKSPFRADRHHLHHLFVRAGFRVGDIVAIAVMVQAAFALFGIGGFLLGVPEYLMFWLFLVVFAVYTLIIARPWRLVPWLRQINRSLGLPSVQVRGIFVGFVRRDQFRDLLGIISNGLRSGYDYQISVYQTDRSSPDGRNTYCVVHIPINGDEQMIGTVHRDTLRVRRRLARQPGVEVRLFLCRHNQHDLRSIYASSLGIRGGGQYVDRRHMRSTLIYSLERGEAISDSGIGFEISVPPA